MESIMYNLLDHWTNAQERCASSDWHELLSTTRWNTTRTFQHWIL